MSNEKYARILLSGIYSQDRLMKTAERMMGIVGRELPKLLPGAETGVLSIRSWLRATPAEVHYKDQNVWMEFHRTTTPMKPRWR